jgi:hypothetical protein
MTSFEEQPDGSVIVKLSRPVDVKGESTSRLTIPRLRGKHMFAIKGNIMELGTGPTIAWGDCVVEPHGAVGELDPMDALEVVSRLVGKLLSHQATGERA